MDPGTIGLIAGILPKLFGGSGGNSASRIQTEAWKKFTEPSMERIFELAGYMFSNYTAGKERGDFDSERLIDRLRQDADTERAKAINNYASASRIMGYKPGDSEPMRQMGAIDEKQRHDWDRTKTELRANQVNRENNALLLPLQAFQAAGGSASNWGSTQANQTANLTQGQGTMADLFGSMLPYLLPQTQSQSQAPLQAASGGFDTNGFPLQYDNSGYQVSTPASSTGPLFAPVP